MQVEYNNNINDITLMIKHIMLNKDMRQRDLCKTTGLSSQAISNILNNRNGNITIETLDKICKGLGCKLYIRIE